MIDARTAVRALLPFALWALARQVDGALGLLLHSRLAFPDVALRTLGLLDASAIGRVLAWIAAGALVWAVLAALRRGRGGGSYREALVSEAGCFDPLYLRPALSILALAALTASPAFPYGFTLGVALTQDLAPAQDAAAFMALVALRAPRACLPAPGGAPSVFFVAFLSYALLTPGWAHNWDNHPGNEPKYLRMAVAIGHRLSLDVEPVSAAMEELTPAPLLEATTSAARGLLRESRRMLRALLAGTAGREAITATRLTRQTIRGKERGVFHVLAPGPSLLLAPSLRVDRALNRARHTPGRVAVSVLLFNALAAALVAAVFLLVRDATARPGLAARLAFAFALAPPFLFYCFQFYPEMLGALALSVLFRRLFFGRAWTSRLCWTLGLWLAALPWLHQKFLPVWGVLTLTALVLAVDRLVSLGGLLGLALPQALSLFLTALYNFAITGSVRPDALFLAWGPGGVSSARLGQGLLGLLLDARYGLLPYAPIYLLALAGLVAPGRGAKRLRLALPAAAVYYLTIAAADNWSGAVCNLGRYLMPLCPLAIAFVGVALERSLGRRGVTALVLILGSWSALLAAALWRDPLAANDSWRLLAKSALADGNAYVPNLFIRSWSDAAPGLFARIAAWLALGLGLSVWLGRAGRGRGAQSPARLLAAVAVGVLGAALLLERWPSARRAPSWPNTIELATATVFAEGPVTAEEGALVAERGTVCLLVRAETPPDRLELVAGGSGLVKLPGRAPLALRPAGVRLELPLVSVARLARSDGASESLLRASLEVEAEAPVVLRFSQSQAGSSGPESPEPVASRKR